MEEMIAMHEYETMTSVSTHEEAGTLMIHHAVEVASNGMNAHIYPQDTDVLFSALPRTPLLGNDMHCGNDMHKRHNTKSSYNLYMRSLALAQRNQEL